MFAKFIFDFEKFRKIYIFVIFPRIGQHIFEKQLQKYYIKHSLPSSDVFTADCIQHPGTFRISVSIPCAEVQQHSSAVILLVYILL